MSGIKISICLCGDTNVGKTSLLNRYLNDQYDEYGQPTLGADYLDKKVILNEKEVVFSFWDTAGQERFKSITNSFFRNVEGGLVVFDLSNLESFQSVETWIKSFRDANTRSGIILLIGNKSDKSAERIVSNEEAENLAKKLDIYYFEVSAKSGSNVNDAFEFLENKCFNNYQDLVPPLPSVDIAQKEESKCKC